MVDLNFKNYVDMEKGETISGKSKLKWKREMYGTKIPHRVFQCSEYDDNKICNQCESQLKINGFECEIVRSCKKCVRKRTQIKYYSNEIKI